MITLKASEGNINLKQFGGNSSGYVDLSNYYKKPEIDSMLENYVEEDYLLGVVTDINENVDSKLENYYDKQDIDAELSEYVQEDILAEILTDVPSFDDLNEAIAGVDVTEQLQDYALKTEIPSLDGYATEEYVNTQIDAIPDVDLTPYATTEYVDTAIEGVDVTEQLADYATKQELTDAIAAIPEVDLTDYRTEEEIIALVIQYSASGGEYESGVGVEY